MGFSEGPGILLEGHDKDLRGPFTDSEKTTVEILLMIEGELGSEKRGIVPRVIEDLFGRIAMDFDDDYDIRVSLLQKMTFFFCFCFFDGREGRKQVFVF